MNIVWLFISTLVFSFFIYIYAFAKGVPTCNHFVSNVYLYLALSLSLCGNFIQLYELYPQLVLPPLAAFLISIVSVVVLAIQPMFSKKGFLFNHFIWLIFLASISTTLVPIFKNNAENVQFALFSTLIIFVTMSLVAVMFPAFLTRTYSKIVGGLMLGLLAILLSELFLFLTGQYTSWVKHIMTYVVVMLFSVFIAYDTNRVYHFASMCVQSPNYPLVSTNLFLDLINIFVRLADRG